MRYIFVILSLAVVVYCGPVTSEDSVLRSVFGSLVNCNSDLGLCLKEHALKAADRFSAARNVKIIDGITLINSNPKESRNYETLPLDPAVRNKEVTKRLWKSTSDIIQSTDIELSYGGSDEDEDSKTISDDKEVEDGRGKKKKEIKQKLKILIPLILLAKAKAVFLVVVSLVVMAASLFKLALLAKIAFIIKIIAIIKEIIAKKHAHEEIQWQPQAWDPHAEHHPVVEHGHGWDGGWSRSRTEANKMAYSGYGI